MGADAHLADRARGIVPAAVSRRPAVAYSWPASRASRRRGVPGTAVFLTGNSDTVPRAMLHNLKHNKVLHERVVVLKVQTE